MNNQLLSLALAASFFCAPVSAQDTATATEDTAATLAAAQADLRDAARRVAELSREQAGADPQQARKRRVMTLRSLDMSRPIIGIVMAENEEGNGVMIAAVTPDGPAAKAGLHSGDQLLVVNGHKIVGKTAQERMAQTRKLIGELKDGDAVKLRYQRDGKEQQITLKAESMPSVMMWHRNGDVMVPHSGHDGTGRFHGIIDPGVEMEIARIAPMAGCADDPDACRFNRLRQAFRWSGLSLAEINPGLGHYFGTEAGVLVLRDGKDGLDQLKAGDVITAIDGKEVKSPRAVMRALREKEAGSKITFAVLRDKRSQQLEVTSPALREVEFFAPPAPPKPPSAPQPPPPPKPPTDNSPV
ncbi:MAG: PDZ domain-containing protein [Xanthomonadales bacterium]|nr:PDZ domain-containing protein [Xanthomonadales bacterium]MDZ4117456.1 PDZ domain-containing protein [Xanthomonadaceae bacterium]